jgi:hypothetical protein
VADEGRAMRQAGIRCLIVGVGFLLVASSGAKGIDRETISATLRGLEGVEVIVEEMDSDVERAGLTRNQIQTDVDLRLRKAGIRVLTRQERQSMPGHPWLYVRVSTRKSTHVELYGVSIGVELNQSVYLARDPNVQERLADKGFNPGPLDGQMDEKTQVALRQFQHTHRLPPTGGLDEATRSALGLE